MLKAVEVQVHCPSCGANRTVVGQLNAGDVGAAFVPNGLRFTRAADSRVAIQRVVRACTECGLVWTMLDPIELRDRLDIAGTDATRRWLADETDERALT